MQASKLASAHAHACIRRLHPPHPYPLPNQPLQIGFPEPRLGYLTAQEGTLTPQALGVTLPLAADPGW